MDNKTQLLACINVIGQICDLIVEGESFREEWKLFRKEEPALREAVFRAYEKWIGPFSIEIK